MQFDPSVTAKAKKYLRRWYFSIFLITVLYFILFYIFTVLWGVIGTIICFVLAVSSPSRLGDILGYKLIFSIVLNKLDADTYLAMIYHTKFIPRHSANRLLGEYYCGNYMNVVSICNQKLSDPKTKKYSDAYLLYLANVYFDVGDDEKLRRTMNQYKDYYATLKPKQQAILKNDTKYKLYDCYLNGNTEEFRSYYSKNPTKTKIQQITRIFTQARLDIVDGNVEQAREHYEYLAKTVPQLNYGKLAILTLEKLNNGESFETAINHSDIIPEIINDKDIPVFKSHHRVFQLIIAILSLMFALSLGRYILHYINYPSYEEEIRVLVEKDYDGVVILDTFRLKFGETTVDTMFICETDTEVMVCTAYINTDQKKCYDVMASISKDSLLDDNLTSLPHSFPAITSHLRVYSCFCTNKEYLRDNYFHLSTFEVDGKTVYYVVTSIVPEE